MTNSNLPLVSVIIAFLNEEEFLVEAVESVLQQDYGNWELLLVDDGSLAGSSTIAKNFAAAYPGKIRYIEHEGHQNKGVCVSRNLGVENAKGELIALLDADDVWLPGKLSNQVAIFQQHEEIGMVAEASDYWYSWEKPAADDVVVPVGAPQDKVYQPKELLYHLYPLRTGSAPCPSGLMLTKAAVLKVGGFEAAFTRQYQLYEDQAFLCKVYLQEKVYVSAACNNLYRQRPGSVVKWVHEKGHYHTVRLFFLEWLEAYLQQERIKDEGVWKLLKKALQPYRHPKLHYLTGVLPGKVKQFLRSRKLMLTR